MIKNYYKEKGQKKSIHGGEGLVDSVKLFGQEDFESQLKYVAFTSIDPGASIGYHSHENQREEVYVIIEGCGRMTIDGKVTDVVKGDTIFTPVGASHGLENISSVALDVFVFWVEK